MEDSLRKRYGLKLVSNIVNGLINVVMVALVPKRLGTVAYGQFTYLQQYFLRIIGLLDAGTSMAFFTKLSAHNKRKELITFQSILTLLMLVLMLVFVAVVNALGYSERFFPGIEPNHVYLGVGLGFLTWSMQLCIKISDAYVLTVSTELVKIFHKLLSLAVLCYFIFVLPFGLASYFYFHFIALGSFVLILLFLFMKKGVLDSGLLPLGSKLKGLVSEYVIFCSPLLVFNLFVLGIELLDIWVLQRVSGSVQMGFHGLAYSIAAMCFLFTSAMTPIITREFSKSHAEGDAEGMRRLFSRNVPMLYSIAAYFGVFIAFQSGTLLNIFTDNSFAGAAPALVVMAFYPIHQTYGQLSGAIFFATGDTKLYAKTGFIASLIGLVFTVVLLFMLKLGAVGLAWKMVVVQFLAVNIQLYFNCRHLELPMGRFLAHQAYSLLFFVAPAFVASLFGFGSILVGFLVSGVVYTILVAAGVWFFPQVVASSRQEIVQLLSQLAARLRRR